MATARLVIKGGRLVDRTGVRSGDVLVGDDGRILGVGPDLDAPTRIDAAGCIVGPGLVDLHAHLRQPGDEEAETIESGARAAAAGGFTCIVAMPDTMPVVDTAAAARDVLALGSGSSCEVLVAGALTMGQAGEQLAPIAELAALGVRFFSDNATIADARLARRVMEYASAFPVVLAQPCADPTLSAGTHMHEGEWSSHLGIAGAPSEAEELIVMRDIALARLTGARLHFQQLSTAGSIAMVGAARAGGLPVTCEVLPPHFSLTHESCAGYDARFKLAPPLRTAEDLRAVRAGLADGSIDCIASGHTPHRPDEVEQPFDEAPTGAVALETALAVALTELDLPVERVLALLSWRPAEILGVTDRHGGPISEGRPANLCVFDPEQSWTVDPSEFSSRSRNTPYAGRTLRGRVRHTILEGEPVFLNGEATR